MVSAAKGAEDFYTIEHHASRLEGIEEAKALDTKAAEAWVGHPYMALVDNDGSNFESKINSLISKVAWSVGIDVGDRLTQGAKKVKFVVNDPLPNDNEFPSFRDFDVCHHYLQTASRMLQSRLRKRGCNGKWSYTHTIRKVVSGQTIEVKTPLNHRDYSNLISQEDPNHFLIYKTRRCFLWENQYFQLDIYREPSHDRCKGLMLLETYTTKMGEDLQRRLPPFLNVGSGVTGDPAFSMFNLSLKEDWSNNMKFCHRLTDEEDRLGIEAAAQEAQIRFRSQRSRHGSPDSGSGDDSTSSSESQLNDSNGNPTMIKSRNDMLPLISSSLSNKSSVSPEI